MSKKPIIPEYILYKVRNCLWSHINGDGQGYVCQRAGKQFGKPCLELNGECKHWEPFPEKLRA